MNKPTKDIFQVMAEIGQQLELELERQELKKENEKLERELADIKKLKLSVSTFSDNTITIIEPPTFEDTFYKQNGVISIIVGVPKSGKSNIIENSKHKKS